MTGKTFTSHGLAEILRDLLRSEASGCLSLSGTGGSLTQIYFSQGLIELAERRGPHLELLSRLASRKVLPTPLPARLRKEPPDPATLARLLRGAIADAEVRQLLRLETKTALREAFAPGGGMWRFTPSDATASLDPDIPSTLEMMLAGFQNIQRWASVRRTLAAQNRALRPAQVPLFPLERLPLSPEEGYLLERMDGKATYAEIAALFPGDEDLMTRFIFAALVLGFVEFDPALVEPFQLDAYANAGRVQRLRERKEMERIDEFFGRLKDTTPQQLLGVDDTTKPEEIRRLYESLREFFQAESFLPQVRHQRREELQIIETSILEAYLSLQSGRMNRAGRQTRQRTISKETNLNDMAGRRLESQKSHRQEEIQLREEKAEAYLEKARESFRCGDFHSTVEFCTLANRHFDANAECHALLGEALARNPARRWQQRAEKAFSRALELDPWNPHLYLKLADLYRQQGLHQRAARYEARARQISPSLPAASR
ncbi:MAG: DUF4388 domain-containing protein [Acidobacteriota bacterium]